MRLLWSHMIWERNRSSYRWRGCSSPDSRSKLLYFKTANWSSSRPLLFRESSRRHSGHPRDTPFLTSIPPLLSILRGRRVFQWSLRRSDNPHRPETQVGSQRIRSGLYRNSGDLYLSAPDPFPDETWDVRTPRVNLHLEDAWYVTRALGGGEIRGISTN